MNTKRKDNLNFTSLVKSLKKTSSKTKTKKEISDEIDCLKDEVLQFEDKETYLKTRSLRFDIKQWEEFYNTVAGNKKIRDDYRKEMIEKLNNPKKAVAVVVKELPE